MSVFWILAPLLVLVVAEPPPSVNYPRPGPALALNDQKEFRFPIGFSSPTPPTSKLNPSAPIYYAPSPTPSQQYHRPSQQYGSPSQQYGSPSEQYGAPSPTPVFGGPSGQYGPPSQVYGSPSGEYGTPNSFRYNIPSARTTLQPPLERSFIAEPTQSYGVSDSSHIFNEIPGTSYGVPDQSPAYGPPQITKVIKHVSVFIAPEEPSGPKTRTIRVKGEAEKHVNIIFIKSPDNGNKIENVEVELPPAPEQKTLVYVLSKNNQDEAPEITIKPNPKSTKPATPDVYFIRYKTPPKDRYGVPGSGTSSSFSEYGNLFNSFQQSADYSNPEPIMVNGPLNPDEVTNYAPKMDHKSYNFISKRETAQGNKGVVDLNVPDFRPYSYAPKLNYSSYQVKGY